MVNPAPTSSMMRDTSASPKPSVARPGRVGVSLRSGDRGPAEEAFAALLTATSAMGQLPLRDLGGASPAQMFEPRVADAHERRQAALKGEYRTAQQRTSATDGPDPTSVQARRAARAGERGLADPTATAPRESPGGRGRVAATPGGDPGFAPNVGVERSAGSSAVPDTPLGDLKLPRLSAGPAEPSVLVALNGSNHGESSVTAVPGKTEVGSMAAVATGRAAQPSGQLARQVAEILSTGRVGEVESPRAVGLSERADGARQGAANRRGTPSAAGREASGNSSSRAAGETPTTARMEFDQLIRALRLRTGLRNSSARLHLQPPELGRIQVDVRMTGNELRIAVQTETTEARNLLAQRAASLTTALEQWGLNVERLEISVDLSKELAQGFVGSGYPDVPARSGRPEHPPRSANLTDRMFEGEAGPSLEFGDEPEPAVVAEARLDIRV